jgi:hypothetical protein
MPADAPAGILHPVQRGLGRRKGIVEELALARQHLGPSIEERTRHDDDPRPRAFYACAARGRGNVALSRGLCGPG